MTQEEFREIYAELAESVKKDLLRKGDDLLQSGAVELKDYRNQYRRALLPRLAMKAALMSEFEGFPLPLLSKREKAELKNFQHFV